MIFFIEIQFTLYADENASKEGKENEEHTMAINW